MTKNIRIAYVEDEPSIANLLAQGLALFGIKVHPIFMAAEEFLNNTESQELKEVEMFIFDIRLPRMTGLDLAGNLRERGRTTPFFTG